MPIFLLIRPFAFKKIKKNPFQMSFFGGYGGLKKFFRKKLNLVDFLNFFGHNLLAFRVTNQ